MVNFMGMNIESNRIGNIPQMNKAAETEQTAIKPEEQTVKESAAFPEDNNSDAQKTIYDESVIDRLGEDFRLKPGDMIKHRDGSVTVILSPSSVNGDVGRHRNFPA